MGQMVAFAEGRTAASPWYPTDIPVDAYCCLIVENLEYSPPTVASNNQPAKPNGKKTRQKVRL
jgi:hypothetical protein